MASMVYKAFLQIQRSGKVHLFESTTPDYADGEQMRDFVYVKDVVEIIWGILQSQQGSSPIRGIHNVGSGRAQSWNELMRFVFTVLGREPNIVYVPMPDELRDQYQHFTEADMTTLAHEFQQRGMQLPSTSLEDAISDYIGSHLLHSWHYL